MIDTGEIWRDHARRQHERALAAERSAVRALVEALPRCNNGSCQSPATHSSLDPWCARPDRLLFLACDECAKLGYAPRELPWAPELRALRERMAEWPKEEA